MGAPVLTSLVRTSASPYLYTAEFTHSNIASGKTAGSYLLKLYDGETGGGGLLQLNGTTGSNHHRHNHGHLALRKHGDKSLSSTPTAHLIRKVIGWRSPHGRPSRAPAQARGKSMPISDLRHRVVHLIKTNPRGTPSFFRIDDGIAAGDYQLVFATTPSADYDTYFRAKNSSGTDVDTDSEVTDETPHTLEVTADGTYYISRS